MSKIVGDFLIERLHNGASHGFLFSRDDIIGLMGALNRADGKIGDYNNLYTQQKIN